MCFTYMCVLICYTVIVNKYIFVCLFYKQTGNICLLGKSENLASDNSKKVEPLLYFLTLEESTTTLSIQVLALDFGYVPEEDVNHLLLNY